MLFSKIAPIARLVYRLLALQKSREMPDFCSAKMSVVVVAFLVAAPSLIFADDGAIDFESQVRPIFQRHCYECHSGDNSDSGLRLDVRDAAFAGGELYGAAIEPGNAARSPLFMFVSDEDADLQMPPEGPRLLDGEIDILRRWINEGASWPEGIDTGVVTDPRDHWAFRPLRSQSPPVLTSQDLERFEHWGREPIDRFVLKRLEEAGLTPSPEAKRDAWLRRVTFDLTGLPPTPDEVRQFLEDPRPDAYERVVDRLFASPTYGERMAQHWLDVVRYADTHGFEVNTERPNAWPYRDYVIDAFNRDTPFDQLVREQIVGDQIQKDAATGFLITASVLLPGQIGQDEPSKRLARQDSIDEIVVNLGQSFLGLSIGCARCHSHKFDPISQRDYYAMQAFVAGVEYEDRSVVDVDSEKDAVRRREALSIATSELAQLVPMFNSGNGRPAINPMLNIERFESISADRVRLTILKTNRLEPCIDEFEVIDSEGNNIALASLGATVTASGSNTAPNRHELRFVNDGQYGNSRSWMSNEVGGGWVELQLPHAAEIKRIQWGRDRFREFPDRLAIEYRIEVALDEGPWVTVATHEDRAQYDELTAKKPVGEFPDDPALAQKAEASFTELDSLLQAVKNNPEGGRLVFAGRFRTPDMIRLLRRGDPEQPMDEVLPAVPEVLGDLQLNQESSDGQRRKELADWISSGDNPLTARVFANRLWQWHFGTGPVDTPNDFGRHGSLPTHPELLDYLAMELVDSHWSYRTIQRRIVLSATYRQSAAFDPEKAAVDADTRLLWRYPRRRLDGESLHDATLAIAGQLECSMGGPGYDLFDKRGGLSGFNPIEVIGEKNCRRMIYAHRVRRERDAVFGTFDCPDGGQSTPIRRESTTPIQALNLMNSPMLIQLSQKCANVVQAKYPNSIDKQIEEVFLKTLARVPTVAEQDSLKPIVEREGLVPLCRALFNSNEFVYLP